MKGLSVCVVIDVVRNNNVLLHMIVRNRSVNLTVVLIMKLVQEERADSPRISSAQAAAFVRKRTSAEQLFGL